MPQDLESYYQEAGRARTWWRQFRMYIAIF
jgi:hypothetical protein